MGKFITSFADHNAYQQVIFDENNTPNVSLCKDNYEIHYNPLIVPPPPPMVDGHEYVEIGSIKWATMNIGANSVTDYGLYFQWSDTQGYTASQVGEGEGQKYFGEDDCIYYNNGSYTKYNETDGLITLESTDDAVTAAWGRNWRMPTTSEFIMLGEAVNTTWTNDYQGSGITGLICTDKTDSSKVLFFPACNGADYGIMHNMDNYGYYWSSSISADYGDINAYRLCFDVDSGYVNWYDNSGRFNGYPIRGVVNE